MKPLKLFLVPVLDSLEFGWQVIRYALIFVPGLLPATNVIGI